MFYFQKFRFFQMFIVSMFFSNSFETESSRVFFLGGGKFFFLKKNVCKFFGLKEAFIVTKNKWLFSLSEVFFFSRIFFSKIKSFPYFSFH